LSKRDGSMAFSGNPRQPGSQFTSKELDLCAYKPCHTRLQPPWQADPQCVRGEFPSYVRLDCLGRYWFLDLEDAREHARINLLVASCKSASCRARALSSKECRSFIGKTTPPMAYNPRLHTGQPNYPGTL